MTGSICRHGSALAIGLLLLGAALVNDPAEAGFTNHGNTLLGVNFESRSASLADIDNDGDLDVLFQGSVNGELWAQQLYRNDLIGGGGFGFTHVADLQALGLGPSWSAAWADINGDRLPDLFVGQSNIGASGDYLVNGGSFGFFNSSAVVGLDDPGFHQNVAWADIDRDNDLDLVIGMEGPEPHEIYLQGAGGTFTPVGASVGFQQFYGTKGYGMAIGDTDGDGDLDVYISTCIGSNSLPNNFYENRLAQTGSLSFVDIANTNGTQFTANSYGAEFLDMDDDGDLDLFLAGADQQPSKIFRNDGNNQFTDVDTITGHPLLSDTGGDLNGSRAVDYDNDGDLDLFFHDHLSRGGSNQARKLYRNDGNWIFTDVTVAEGLGETNKGSYDSTWGDLDRDGDQDLVATTDSGTNERIYLSDESTNGNHWLYVELEGPSFNTTGVGATVYATMGEKTLRREANTNAGTFNQSDLPVHFGMAGNTVIDELRVVWTDGRVQVLSDVSADQYLTIDYADLLTGDFNGDGVVDAADYTVWRDQSGLTQIGAAADANGDGEVDAADYDLWRDNYGATAASLAIPEPTALVLGLFAAACGIRRR